ncbi:MAG: hypothetical protein H0S79_14920 [Anaerolineaceae bacterium]|nr:hypothetical protein [Anaerolineaceae bacterium]
MRKILPLIFIITSMILFGCQSTPSTEPAQIDVNSTESSESGYPISDIIEGYPVDDYQNTYPTGPDFSINTPLNSGDLVVTGTGPAGVPIILIDATEVGELLGTTVINEDGTFQFDLANGLIEQHQIGIQLGDLTGTDLNANDFVYNDNYYVRPLIGIMFDMVLVEN